VTPAARLAAAIDLLDAIESASRRPADAVANDFFRARRYVGGGDRRAVSERVWGVLRRRLRLGWWLELVDARPTARLLVAVDLLLAEGLDLPAVLRAFPGGQYAAEALNGPEERALRAIAGRRRAGGVLEHPGMSEAVRLELPEWVLPGFRARFGPRLGEEAAAMMAPAARPSPWRRPWGTGAASRPATFRRRGWRAR